MEILQYTALELGRKIQSHEISAKEALKAVLDRIRRAPSVRRSAWRSGF